jgi:tetratricopeptide (TPR) repeat protein
VLLIDVSLAERLMYWPSVPALLLIASLIVEGWRRACTGAGPLAHRAGLLRVAGMLLLGALCIRTVTRNAAWADDATLFSTDLAEWPNNAQMLVTRARHLVYDASHAGDPRERLALLSAAESLARRSLEVHVSSSAYRVMGELLGVRGERERALQYLYLARQINPRDVLTQTHIAALEGRDVDAEAAALKERIAAQPGDTGLRMELASLLVAHGRHRQARPHLEHVLRLQPDHLAAQRLLAQVHMLDHEPEPAIALFRAVLDRDPSDWDSHLNLAYLLQQRDPAACLLHARRAAELRPDDLRTRTGLAEALLINGHTDEALAMLRQLLADLPPGDPLRPAVAERIEQIVRRGR